MLEARPRERALVKDGEQKEIVERAPFPLPFCSPSVRCHLIKLCLSACMDGVRRAGVAGKPIEGVSGSWLVKLV